MRRRPDLAFGAGVINRAVEYLHANMGHVGYVVRRIDLINGAAQFTVGIADLFRDQSGPAVQERSRLGENHLTIDIGRGSRNTPTRVNRPRASQSCPGVIRNHSHGIGSAAKHRASV